MISKKFYFIEKRIKWKGDTDNQKQKHKALDKPVALPANIQFFLNKEKSPIANYKIWEHLTTN